MTAADTARVLCDGAPGNLLNRTLSAGDAALMRSHLDACTSCLEARNAFRRERASTSLYRDLRAFPGPGFRYGSGSSRALALDWDAASGDAAGFFRTSTSRLCGPPIWEASGNRPPYADEAVPVLDALGVRSISGYGSGIGSDTPALRRPGFAVTPCDCHSPSSRYFQRRARRARQGPSVGEPGRLPPVTGADTLSITGTLDRLPDPAACRGHLLASVTAVVCGQLAEDRGHGRQGFRYRRPASETAAVLARYGSRLTESNCTVACWYKPGIRKPAGQAPAKRAGDGAA